MSGMEKLLHWSVVNSQDDKEAIEKVGVPDPRVLQQLFGNGSGATADDPTLMKDALLVGTNPEATVENRVIALDNFEMLIENLDNANNIENMKMWEHLIKLLSLKEPEIVAITCSIIGTAVQNNIDSQNNYIKYPDGMTSLINLAKDEKQTFDVRTKALYSLSNLLRNNKTAASKFEELKGLDIIAPILNDDTNKPKLKLRAVNLLSACLSSEPMDEKLIKQLREDNLITNLIENLRSDNNLNLIDRILHILGQIFESKAKFSSEEITILKKNFSSIIPLEDRLNEEDFILCKKYLN